MQEWELVSFCNYKCFYCKLPKIKTELNEEKIEAFISKLDPNIELFCFGGEPFLHPKINFILYLLKKYKQPFVIQSNASDQSFKIIQEKNLKNFNLQLSIHPTEKIYSKKNIIQIQIICKKNNINLRRIDVMYSSENALNQYFLFKKYFNDKVWLSPIAGFYENDSCIWTKKFNELRTKRKDIQFEDYEINGKQRSIIWQEQCENKFSTFGRPCPYNYKLFDSMLNEYNCCYREKNTDGICKHQRCFWM